MDAMRRSINTVFYRMGIDAGPANVAATAHKMGIPAERSNGQKTLQEKDGTTQAGISIGQYEVRTIDQAQGFGVFATGGTLHPAHFVAKVVDSGGRVVYQHEDKATQVIDSKVANDVTYSMKPVAAASRGPAGRRARVGGEDRHPAVPGHRRQQRRLDGRLHPQGERRGLGRHRQAAGHDHGAGQPDLRADAAG